MKMRVLCQSDCGGNAGWLKIQTDFLSSGNEDDLSHHPVKVHVPCPSDCGGNADWLKTETEFLSSGNSDSLNVYKLSGAYDTIAVIALTGKLL